MIPLLHIAVTNTTPYLKPTAQTLAKQLVLPYVDIAQQGNFDFNLVLTETGLLLQDVQKKGFGSLQIDFLTGKIGYRLQHLRTQKQLLAKAIGCKVHHTKTSVLDLTAGLGSDGFILAQLGYLVTLLERSGIVVVLLQDGLQRALGCKKYSHLDIQLIHVDAIVYLKQLMQTKNLPDVIYLDPMYPYSKKSALVKKEMRFLRQVVGDDTDAESLLPLAITCARQRVVVKRPRLASYLAKLQPQHSIRGQKHRFDVYTGVSRIEL